MSILDLARALGGAFAHRLRAVLTMLGIVIGTGSIVLLASLLHGGERFLVHANQSVSDDDVIEAHPDEPAPAQRDRTSRPLSRSDAVAARESGALEGRLVASESSVDTRASFQGRQKNVTVVSTGPSTFALYRLRVTAGRALDAEDLARGDRVCVIGHEIHEELLRSATSLDGLRIEIGGSLFAIVGVLERKPMLDATDSTAIWSRKVMIPDVTFDVMYAPSHEVQHVFVREGRAPEDTAKAERKRLARAAFRSILLRRHHGVLNFALAKDQSGGTEQLILTIIQVLMFGTGFLALLASGINIMNVMLVTVSERRREIGLRRAIGATPRSVLVQFLLEALGLSGAGAIAGVLMGALLAVLVALAFRSLLGHWELAIPLWSVGLGVFLALATGLVFGLVPAWRAAHVSPIDALRSD
jgi:putative ABC transport system permease protein